MESSVLRRIFKINGNEVEDPNSELPVDVALNMLSPKYPEIISAKPGTPEYLDDKVVYTISNRPGTHG